LRALFHFRWTWEGWDLEMWKVCAIFGVEGEEREGRVR
jgi:hypothetical protein